MSLGESISSAIKLTDIKGAKQIYEKDHILDISIPSINSFDETIKSVFVALKWVDVNAKEEEVTSQINNFLGMTKALLEVLPGLMMSAHCSESTICEAKMSGTSMATPAVAGVVARLVAEKMKKAGLQDGDIYLDAQFSVDTITQDLLKRSPNFGGNTFLAPAKKVVDIKDYVPQAKTPLSECAALIGLGQK